MAMPHAGHDCWQSGDGSTAEQSGCGSADQFDMTSPILEEFAARRKQCTTRRQPT